MACFLSFCCSENHHLHTGKESPQRFSSFLVIPILWWPPNTKEKRKSQSKYVCLERTLTHPSPQRSQPYHCNWLSKPSGLIPPCPSYPFTSISPRSSRFSGLFCPPKLLLPHFSHFPQSVPILSIPKPTHCVLWAVKLISKISISLISIENFSIISFLGTLSADFMVSIAKLSSGKVYLLPGISVVALFFLLPNSMPFSSLHNFSARLRPPAYSNNYPFIIADT